MADLARLIQPTDSDYVHYYNQLDFANGIEAYYSEKRTLVIRSNQVEVEYNNTQWHEVLEQYNLVKQNIDENSIFVLYQPSDDSTHIVTTAAQLFMLGMVIDTNQFD